jgi:lipid A disaccharide synthetase
VNKLKRAIRAIHIYNTEVATEPSDHWMITASAIATLIGSRQSTIKEIMQQFQTSIDENNLKPNGISTPTVIASQERRLRRLSDSQNLYLMG